MTERIVRKVEATRQMHTMAPLRALTRRKAACYLRISTRSDEQENSLENQRAHYEELFATSLDYEFAGCYYDDGVSGTGISHRHGFQQMVNDALAGKFTLILTKSISRFGRNVVDSISTIRKLKEYGVECIFEKENIHTFDPKSSFILTIMTAMAENESMSISENVTWGMRQGFAQGKIALPYSHFLGYRKGEDGPEVVEDEAAVVRSIYRRYLEGNSPGQIVKALEAAELLSARGVEAGVVDAAFVKPFDAELLARQRGVGAFVASLENGAIAGGFGEAIGADVRFGWPDSFVGHGTVSELEREFSFTAKDVADGIASALRKAGR